MIVLSPFLSLLSCRLTGILALDYPGITRGKKSSVPPSEYSASTFRSVVIIVYTGRGAWRRGDGRGGEGREEGTKLLFTGHCNIGKERGRGRRKKVERGREDQRGLDDKGQIDVGI